TEKRRLTGHAPATFRFTRNFPRTALRKRGEGTCLIGHIPFQAIWRRQQSAASPFAPLAGRRCRQADEGRAFRQQLDISQAGRRGADRGRNDR
ncbi:hypothetical protein CN211_26265, partial [Sinorhizobium meliloti]